MLLLFLIGPGKPFDTSKYLVVCANVLGSCYGSSGPQSINIDTGKPFGNTFPDVSDDIDNGSSLCFSLICLIM